MDRYDGSDEGSDEQSQSEPISGDASAWGLSEQPAYGDEPSASSEGTEEAAAEYAAWSADTSYQQVQATSETGAYTTEQPVAAFNDQQQPQGQQPAYDPNAYAQQGYDPNAYAQQQQAYAQQQQAYAQQGYDPNAYAQQQQAYAQQGYDPNAYAQQQQAYAQQAYAQQGYTQPGYDPNAYPQQQNPQQGYYDPNAYAQQQYAQPGYGQPGAYDPQAYAQQPSYYDQQAYAQQQWQQGYGAPGQPYAYAQPGQQPWPQDQYWDPKAGGYGRSMLAVLASVVLLAWGLVFTVAGSVIMWQGSLNGIIADMALTPAQNDFVSEFNKQAFNYGAILLLIGIVQLIGGIGVFSHRSWGRAFGIVLGLLGTLWGIGLVAAAVNFTIADLTIEEVLGDDRTTLGVAVIVLMTYLLVLLAMFVGRRHFRRKGVA